MRRHRTGQFASTTASDLRAMAQDMLRMGTHWAQAAQDWLDRTRQDMDEREASRDRECAPGRGERWRGRSGRDFQSDYSGGGYDQVVRGAGRDATGASPAGFGAADLGARNSRNYGRQGGYRGVGPRNYSRSDERIREDLNERLTEADDLDASGITVEVSNGIATLGGVVEQRWMKHRAEDLADDCIGVRDVRNHIQVGSQRDGGTRAAFHGSMHAGGGSAEVQGSLHTGVGNSAGGASPGSTANTSGARTTTGANSRQETPDSGPGSISH